MRLSRRRSRSRPAPQAFASSSTAGTSGGGAGASFVRGGLFCEDLRQGDAVDADRAIGSLADIDADALDLGRLDERLPAEQTADVDTNLDLTDLSSLALTAPERHRAEPDLAAQRIDVDGLVAAGIDIQALKVVSHQIPGEVVGRAVGQKRDNGDAGRDRKQ